MPSDEGSAQAAAADETAEPTGAAPDEVHRGPFRLAAPGGPQAEDLRMVARMIAGDEAAFDTFAAVHVPGLYRFAARRLGGDRELARELAQATVCRAMGKLGLYRGEAPLFTWLCACCLHEIAAHFRRSGRRPREVWMADAFPDPERAAPRAAGDGAEERLLRLETADRVHATLDRLPPAYARAVEWRYLEGLPVPEIAGRLGAGYKATESLLSRARKAFREVYEHLARGPDATRTGGPWEEGA